VGTAHHYRGVVFFSSGVKITLRKILRFGIMTEQAIQVEVENLSDVKRKLQIVVPSLEVSQEVDKAYKDLGKRAKLKGFRPGKVPRAVLEMYYRQQVEREVSDLLVRRGLAEALREKSLEPVGLNWPETLPPPIAGEDYRFIVEVEVPPEFTVENYLGLSLTDPGAEVSAEQVEARLADIRQEHTVLQPLPEPREVQEGDFAVLSYQGYFAGEEMAEGKAENLVLEIGSGKFNVDFERQLVGMMPDSETRFAVSLPNDFFNPLLAGKVVEFKVQIHEIKQKVVPELDDAFAQGLGGDFQTLADLRVAVREGMIKAKQNERQKHLEKQIMDKLAATTTFETPPALIRQEQENLIREQWERIQQYGLQVTGLDNEKVFESVRPRAEAQVKNRLILDRLAGQENIVLDDTEVEVKLQRLAEYNGQKLEQFRRLCEERNILAPLKQQWRNEKVLQFLINKANIVPGPEAPAEEKT
jgi:trigger factor